MSHASTDILSRRHHTLRQAIAGQGLDALVVTSLPNVLYLTNFAGSAGIVVVGSGRLDFLTDPRYEEAVRQSLGTVYECPGLALTLVDGSYDVALARLLAASGFARIGFEADHLSFGRHEWLEATLGTGPGRPELHATRRLVERARVTKDAHELAVLREAAARLSAAVPRVVNEVAAGRTERDVALAIDVCLRTSGFERLAFETIVAAGPEAALPHARPGERKLAEGDLVVLDFGGVYDSYCVDLTRTVSIGRAGERARAVHAAVRAAHDRAIAAVAPGVSPFAVDRAARAALEEAGMADAFGHGTGHGLGIEVHEDPRIVRWRAEANDADEALAPGMVFTIEPGAYFPGWGGVRIEDDVVVTESGVEVITNVTTELLEL